MTSSTINQIYHHASVRNYKPDPIPKEVVEAIVAAGQRSSTSSNLQTYSAIAVTSDEKRNRLAELCGNQDHIRQAPVFIAWCSDRSRLERVCQRRGYQQVSNYVEDFLVSVVDVAIAMQTAALAAESLGIGICYIGAIRNKPEDIIDLLELPKLVFPVSGMTLGYPAGEPRIRPRLPTRAVLHWEHYDTGVEEQALLVYDREMIDTGVYHGRRVPVPGAPEISEDYGWMEHSARRASKPIRTGLRHVIQAQGFDLD